MIQIDRLRNFEEKKSFYGLPFLSFSFYHKLIKNVKSGALRILTILTIPISISITRVIKYFLLNTPELQEMRSLVRSTANKST